MWIAWQIAAKAIHESACPCTPATRILRHHRRPPYPYNRGKPAGRSTPATARPRNSRHARSASDDETDKRQANKGEKTLRLGLAGGRLDIVGAIEIGEHFGQ